MSDLPYGCAQEVLDVVPLIMRAIRTEMRSRRSPDLTVPQFRTLVFLNNNPGASLSCVADYLGLTPPSTSKMMDGLVQRNLVIRQASSTDRRRITLKLTSDGQSILGAAHHGTQTKLAEILSALPPADCGQIVRSMQILRPLFTPGEVGQS
jgi:DNA-binding MarR family transcriptional regulator